MLGTAEPDAGARDPVETQKRQQRASCDPLGGHVTGLVMLMRDDTTIFGDVLVIKVSSLDGRPWPRVTGLRAKVLEGSVRTADRTLGLLAYRERRLQRRLRAGADR